MEVHFQVLVPTMCVSGYTSLSSRLSSQRCSFRALQTNTLCEGRVGAEGTYLFLCVSLPVFLTIEMDHWTNLHKQIRYWAMRVVLNFEEHVFIEA